MDNIISPPSLGQLGSGISVGVKATGTDNMISGNTIFGSGAGIQAGTETIITGNNGYDYNDGGMGAGADCLFSGNNSSHGGVIYSDVRTLLLNNVANSDSNSGIHVGADGSAIGNVADNDTQIYPGFVVQCPSKVDNNTALGNGAPNLSETGAGCLNTNNLAP